MVRGILEYTLCSKKSDAKIQITITTAILSELNILLAALIIIFPT